VEAQHAGILAYSELLFVVLLGVLLGIILWSPPQRLVIWSSLPHEMRTLKQMEQEHWRVLE
jgi:hypothetical protein